MAFDLKTCLERDDGVFIHEPSDKRMVFVAAYPGDKRAALAVEPSQHNDVGRSVTSFHDERLCSVHWDEMENLPAPTKRVKLSDVVADNAINQLLGTLNPDMDVCISRKAYDALLKQHGDLTLEVPE